MWRWKHKAMLLLHVIFDGLAINCLHNLSRFPTIYICVKCVMWLATHVMTKLLSFAAYNRTMSQMYCSQIQLFFVSMSASEICSIWGVNVMMILRYGRYNCMMFGIEVRNCVLLITLKSPSLQWLPVLPLLCFAWAVATENYVSFPAFTVPILDVKESLLFLRSVKSLKNSSKYEMNG